MSNFWRLRKRKYTVIFISDQCKFIYFTTLKTASFTSRAMIDRADCGFGVDLFGNISWRKTCGDHACNNKDFEKLSNENHKYFTILFTRNPIERFESSYNFMYGYVPMRAQKRRYYKPLNITIDDVDENIPTAEMEYLIFIKHFFSRITQNDYIFGHVKFKSFTYYQHFQPIYLSACVGDKCFVPAYVAKMEHMMEHLRHLNETKKLGVYLDAKLFNSTHKTAKKAISKGVTYKYVHQALFPICMLYWNDFLCSDYEIPPQCRQQNDREWHFPYFCVDVNNERVEWPKSLF